MTSFQNCDPPISTSLPRANKTVQYRHKIFYSLPLDKKFARCDFKGEEDHSSRACVSRKNLQTRSHPCDLEDSLDTVRTRVKLNGRACGRARRILCSTVGVNTSLTSKATIPYYRQIIYSAGRIISVMSSPMGVRQGPGRHERHRAKDWYFIEVATRARTASAETGKNVPPSRISTITEQTYPIHLHGGRQTSGTFGFSNL